MLTQRLYWQAVFKGIVLALVLMVTGDLVLNQGQMTHATWTKLGGFASASGNAVHNSVFRW